MKATGGADGRNGDTDRCRWMVGCSATVDSSRRWARLEGVVEVNDILDEARDTVRLALQDDVDESFASDRLVVKCPRSVSRIVEMPESPDLREVRGSPDESVLKLAVDALCRSPVYMDLDFFDNGR